MKLLIGYDGSEYADQALEDLIRAGLPSTSEAVVLTVADVLAPPCPLSAPIEPAIEKAVKNWHSRTAAAVSEASSLAEVAASNLRERHPLWKISAQAIPDSPAWGIIKHAEGNSGQHQPSDLIVLGAAGRSAIGRTIFGSVALKVLHHSPRPVRIGRSAPGKGMRSAVRILIGVDRSDDSTAAVRAVAARKWPPGTECRVVTVFDAQLFTAMAGIDPIFISTYEDWPKQYAEQAAETLRNAGISAAAHVCEGPVAPALIRQATEFDADCIFVGARGLRRVERFLLGSVSSAVAMHANCTVEVVRS